MFKKILVPTDGSPLSEKAIDAAIEFARANGGGIIALSVAEPPVYPDWAGYGITPPDLKAYDERAQELARQHVEKIAKAAQAGGVPCESTVAVSFRPYEEIVAAAGKFNCDIIFMASHGRKGLNKLFVGSETQKVLVSSTTPVLVFR